MAGYGTPTDPVAGTVITVAWAVVNVLDPIRQLRANTGSADPAALNRVAVSTGIGGPSTWQQIPTDAILNAAVTDVKLAAAKVQRTAPAYASFAAAAAELSSLCWINSTPSIADAPVTSTLDWLLLQIRHPNTGIDYRWQLTCSLTDQNELYTRSVIAGTPGTWRKVQHAGNITPYLPLVGGTMSGTITFSDILEGVIFSGGSQVRDDSTPTIGAMQILATQGRVNFFALPATTLMLALSAATAAFTGAVTAASAAITGLITAGSATISGALSAGSATISGALSAATINGTTDVQKNGVSLSRIVSSTYSGNNGASRQITTGFVCRYVVITWSTGSVSGVAHALSTSDGTTIINIFTGAASLNSIGQKTALHASDGFVVDAVDVNGVTNTSGVTYRYVAWG